MEKGELPENEIIAEIAAAVKLDAGNLETRKWAAETLMEMERPRPALKHIEYLERHQPESPELLVTKGTALLMLDKSKKGENCIERAYELDPRNARARRAYLQVLGSRAVDACERGDVDKGIGICLRQIEIDPGYMPALRFLTHLYFHLGLRTEARDIIARIVATDPRDFRVHISAGKLYFEGNYTKDAKRALQRAAELDPGSECLTLI